jgi:UDP-N-acetylglucosamine--N-acetylmuramyl-(pentapeptide) pyrophosphoryl-undecaprenol N-acetylglucosamine transferase
MRFAGKICVSYEQSKKFFPKGKVIFTGNIIRRDLADANKKRGEKFTGFQENLPVIMAMGGSQGAEFINNLIWNNLDELLKHYQVIHICGEDKVKNPAELKKIVPTGVKLDHYRAFEFIDKELKDLYAFCDLVITRCGANTLAELDFFNKPAILIPLGKQASRGDQIDNAKAFAENHVAEIIEESDQNNFNLPAVIKKILSQPKTETNDRKNKFYALDTIINLLGFT